MSARVPGPFSLRRGADMLHLDVVLSGLEIDERGLRAIDGRSGTATFVLPPQSVLEGVFGPATALEPGTVDARLAGRTRVAFEVPDGTAATLEGLLAWADRQLRLSAGQDVADDEQLTAIEAPWGLVLVPTGGNGFTAQPEPVRRFGRTELWHSRLTHSRPDGPPSVLVVGNRAPKNPFTSALTAKQRDRLVEVSGQAPVSADLLLLTPLGASLDLRGDWEPSAKIQGWQHRSTLGRDHFVRVVEPGFLFPLGHRAMLVSMTRRQIVGGGAHLERTQYVVVRDPVRRYDDVQEDFGGRQNPLRTIELLTTVTPPLPGDLGSRDQVPLGGDVLEREDYPFWVQDRPVQDPQRRDVLFEARAVDARGTEAPMRLPMLFVPHHVAIVGEHMKELAEKYNSTLAARREFDLGGSPIDLTGSRERPAGSGKDTTFPVSRVDLAARATLHPMSTNPAAGPQPAFHFVLSSIHAAIPVVAALTGTVPTPVALRYDDGYLHNDFGAGEVFAVLPSAPQLEFAGADQAGGMALPNMTIRGLSRTVGPVAGDLATFAAGGFDPTKFFSSPQAKFLGNIPLAEVLVEESFDTAEAGAGLHAPRIVTEEGQTVLRWSPALKGWKGLFAAPPGARMDLRVTHAAAAAGGIPASTVSGSVGGFSLRFPPSDHPEGETGSHLIELQFSRFSFVSRSGSKPDIDLVFSDVHFVNDLRFVERFKDVIRLLGGFGVEVSPDGISARTSLAIPDMEIGVFALRGLSFGAGAVLPFSDQPVGIDLSFSRRDAPFLMTLSALGGSGYFMMRLTADGIDKLELSLGVAAAVGFGVAGIASGAVSIVAGFVLIYERTDPSATKLGGFLRISGALQVLGLVTLAVELSMMLAYQPEGKVVGQATLKLEVRIAFFSKSISAGVERRFGGSGDPTLADMLSESDWWEYCDAFAPEALAVVNPIRPR